MVGIEFIQLVLEVVAVLDVGEYERVHVHCPLVPVRRQSSWDVLALRFKYLKCTRFRRGPYVVDNIGGDIIEELVKIRLEVN